MRTYKGYSALDYAEFGGHTEIICMLLEYGADHQPTIFFPILQLFRRVLGKQSRTYK